MAFQLFKSVESNDQNTDQNVVNDPTNIITDQYNPLLVQNNINADQVQMSNFDKSYNEDILEETIPNTKVEINQPIGSLSQIIQPITPPIVNSGYQTQQNYQIPNNVSPQNQIYQTPIKNTKRSFPMPNTNPIRPLPNINTLPPAPNYQVETSNYQAVSSVSIPKESDFNIPPIMIEDNTNIQTDIPIENGESKLVEDVTLDQLNKPQIIEPDTNSIDNNNNNNSVLPKVEDVILDQINKPQIIEQDTSSINNDNNSVESKFNEIDKINSTLDINKLTKQPIIINKPSETESIISDNNESDLTNYNFDPVENTESKTVNQMVSNLLNEKNNTSNTNLSLDYTDTNIIDNSSLETDSTTEENTDDYKIDNFSSLSDENILKVKTDPIEEGFKKCPKCGQKIREDYKQCFVCGTYF